MLKHFSFFVVIFWETVPFYTYSLILLAWVLNNFMYPYGQTLLMLWQIEQSYNVTMASFYKTKHDIITT